MEAIFAESGAIGIKFWCERAESAPLVKAIMPFGLAALQPQLRVGLALHSVQGVQVHDKPFAVGLQMVKDAQRPLRLAFREAGQTRAAALRHELGPVPPGQEPPAPEPEPSLPAYARGDGDEHEQTCIDHWPEIESISLERAQLRNRCSAAGKTSAADRALLEVQLRALEDLQRGLEELDRARGGGAERPPKAARPVSPPCPIPPSFASTCPGVPWCEPRLAHSRTPCVLRGFHTALLLLLLLLLCAPPCCCRPARPQASAVEIEKGAVLEAEMRAVHSADTINFRT